MKLSKTNNKIHLLLKLINLLLLLTPNDSLALKTMKFYSNKSLNRDPGEIPLQAGALELYKNGKKHDVSKIVAITDQGQPDSNNSNSTTSGGGDSENTPTTNAGNNMTPQLQSMLNQQQKLPFKKRKLL